jgi:uncharacterized protein YjbI with pentapeptide repeats
MCWTMTGDALLLRAEATRAGRSGLKFPRASQFGEIKMRILRRDGSFLTDLPSDKAGTLNSAFLYGVDLSDALLDGVPMEGAELGNAKLCGASLKRTDLYWADCSDTDFTGADLEAADLRGAILKNATLRRTNLAQADLGFDQVKGRTQLQGADLSGADVRNARFEGAVYDSSTIFPAGFDPAVHQMLKAED